MREGQWPSQIACLSGDFSENKPGRLAPVFTCQAGHVPHPCSRLRSPSVSTWWGASVRGRREFLSAPLGSALTEPTKS